MKDKVREAFNQMANAYEHSVDSESLYNAEYERPAMMRRIQGDLTGIQVLDAGCAAGWYTNELLDRGANVIGIDMSPDMVDAANRRVGDKAQILCLDLEADLPFEDDSFDLLISSLTLHYLESWENTFSEFHRILKADSTILFSIHHPMTDIRLLENSKYFSTELIVDTWKKDGQIFSVPFYRRPLNEIINTILPHFVITRIIEPLPTKKFKEQDPERYYRLMRKPDFLIIEAKKKSSTIRK